MSLSPACSDASDAPQPSGISTTYQDEEASAAWEQRYLELVHFQAGHGHCRVPVDSGVLGKWVMHVREKYKKFQHEQRYRGQLTQERIDRLNTLGFEWSLRPPNTPWQERFQQLHHFYVTHGHTRVKHSQHGESFAEWVQKQRKLLRNGKLSQERVALLQSVNFEERLVATPNKTWEESLELLLDFRRQHGHARVPKPIKGMPAGDDHSLRVWADRQRTYYHAYYLKKKTCTLTKKRVKKLENVGFDWGAHRSNQTRGWNLRFQELKDYLHVHGDTNVPTNYPQNKSLGRWVSEQRSHYNKMLKGQQSSLTMERRVALESIGFQWKGPKKGRQKKVVSSSNASVAVASAAEEPSDIAAAAISSEETNVASAENVATASVSLTAVGKTVSI